VGHQQSSHLALNQNSADLLTDALAPIESYAPLRDAVLKRSANRRLGKPEDLADAAIFLATCDFVAGQVIEVDGGWTAT